MGAGGRVRPRRRHLLRLRLNPAASPRGAGWAAQLLTWLLTFVQRVYGHDRATGGYQLLHLPYVQPLLRPYFGMNLIFNSKSR